MALLSGAIKRARTAWPAARADRRTGYAGVGAGKSHARPKEWIVGMFVPAAVPGAAGDAGPHLRPARAQMASSRPRERAGLRRTQSGGPMARRTTR